MFVGSGWRWGDVLGNKSVLDVVKVIAFIRVSYKNLSSEAI
jgi:hypothetical protein